MKVLVAVVVAAMCAIAGAATANAEHKRYHKRWVGYDAPLRYHKQSYPNEFGWYPHDSNQLTVGSRIWWDQMEREGRLGRRN